MILDTLAEAARGRVAAAKKVQSFEEVRKKALALPKGDFCFEKTLKEKGISFICEAKKASPSKGVIAEAFPYVEIAKDYEAAGASAISCLTEPAYFLGKDAYLTEIKAAVNIPVLRKDFTVDAYQLYEAKIIGADAVLLICALLDTQTIKDYIEICDTLGLSALVEAHTAEEVRSALEAGARIIGVNNRDLKTFHVDLNTCIRLRSLVPEEIPFVAESGIQTAEDIRRLHAAGVDAVLIGETLMRSSDRKAGLDHLKSGMRPRIKICGLKRPCDIEAVNEAGPDYMGFVFAKSKRQVTPEQAAELKALLDPSIPSVGVFVNESQDVIAGLCKAGTIDLVQLHGDEDNAYIAELRQKIENPIIKAVRFRNGASMDYDSDYLLLDAYSDKMYGGTGESFDWKAIGEVPKPYFLAGGIHVENILDAARYGSFCIDVSSGVETDGLKDREKILQIVSKLRSYANE